MDKQRKNLLVFGYGLSLILALFGWHSLAKYGPTGINGSLFVLSFVILLITLFNKRVLEAIYRRWMIGAHAIGTVVTAVLMTAIFYIVFTPVGLLLRIIKKDYLRRRFDRNDSSYWIQRDIPPFNQKRYTQQF